MSFKGLFRRSLEAAEGRLHFAAHSHHLWPDASHDGHLQAWIDAAQLADRKWDKIMGEIVPAAQAEVSGELGTGDPSAIAFSANTHDFILRLASACPRSGGTLRVLTTDGEFHSARRQFDRWGEDHWFVEEKVAVESFGSFAERFAERARSGDHHLIFVSQVMFGTGAVFDRIDELARLASPEGPWVVIDGYHSFMALADPLEPALAANVFFLSGGYKYAMAGEGCAFLHAPRDYGSRPAATGWFAELDDLTQSPGKVGYAPDARRFLGATFDPSGLYRFNAVRSMLRQKGLTTQIISDHCRSLQHQLLGSLEGTILNEAELLNPLFEGPQARFLAFRDPRAKAWEAALKERDCITDVRGDVIRIGFAIYQDEDDVGRLVGLLKALS